MSEAARAFVDAFPFMAHNFGLLLQQTLSFLAIVGAAMGGACLIALPLGLGLGHWHRGSLIGVNFANVARALPTPAIIAFLLVFVGIGFPNIVLALVVAAIPPILVNTYVGIVQVDPNVVESARAIGLSEFGILARVETRLAMPLLFGGLRTAFVFVVGTAPLAALIGGSGLGIIIVNQPSYGLDGVIAATIWVAALAVGGDFAFGLVERALTPNVLKKGPLVTFGVLGRARTDRDRVVDVSK
jgi:osmoprotectant transport system permease protein